MSEFIGLCKQNGASVYVTKTVNDEAFDKLHTIINRYFDRAKIFAPTIRHYVYRQLRRRLIDLVRYTGNNEITSTLTHIKDMYLNFSKDTELRKKLVALKQKKSRQSLLPSDIDMKILSEAETCAKRQVVYFITGDNDYIEFKNEIEKETSIIVVDLMYLRNFYSKLFGKV